MGAYDPIKSVTPIDYDGNATGPAVTDLPQPSVYRYGAPDEKAERKTESGAIIGGRKGRRHTIGLEWRALSIANGSAVMSAFSSEYVRVEFLDGMAGAWIVRDFIVRPGVAPLYHSVIGLWESLSYEIEQRDMDVI